MSAVEHDAPVESRSKVKVARNAKGDAQWEVSVVEGTDVVAMNALRLIAVEQYRELEKALAGAAS